MLKVADVGLGDFLVSKAKSANDNKEGSNMGETTPISIAYLQYNKSGDKYTVKSLQSEQIKECASRYDAIHEMRKEAMGSITASGVHVNSTDWVARKLKGDFAKAMENDGAGELAKKHDLLHQLSDDKVSNDQAYLHHFIMDKAREMGQPIDCEGGALSQPVILDSKNDMDINEAIASGAVSQEDGKAAIDDGVKRANVITLMDSDGAYAVVVPTDSEGLDLMGEIEKSLDNNTLLHFTDFGKSNTGFNFLDFAKADRVPKILTDIVDDGKPDQYTLAPYYIPNRLDGHKEWVETRDLEKAVNEWSLLAPNRNVFLQHDESVVAGTWTQLIVMPWEFDAQLRQHDGTIVTKHYPVGTVLIGVVWFDWAWELILQGKITGMSMGGMAKEKADSEIPNS